MATAEWTVLEKLLLSQAVYKYGEDNWFQIARNLKHHALLDRPSDYFNQKNCSLQYYLMVEELDKEKRNIFNQDMPVVVQLARQLYNLRLEELKKAISEDEEKFLMLVSEIDDIRAGKWDDKLLSSIKDAQNGMETTPVEDKEGLANTPTDGDEGMHEQFEPNTTENTLPASSPPSSSSPTSIAMETTLDTNQPTTESSKEEEQQQPLDTAREDVDQTTKEEEYKIEKENIENETRDIRQDDVVSVGIEKQAPIVENTVTEPLQGEDKTNSDKHKDEITHEIVNRPDSIIIGAADTLAPIVGSTEKDDHEIKKVAIPEINITTSKPINDTNLMQETKEDEEEALQTRKRQPDASESLDEPSLKRQRTEDSSNPLTVKLEAVVEEEGSNKKREVEPLVIDTTRIDYSTDVSQGTTPADTSDINLRDGTESIAGSESNAATPTTERRRGLNRDDQRHKSWQKNINLLWREIANHKNGAMFMNPIKENIAPHYYDIVKRPMDLKTIKNRIRDGFINTTAEFERDVVLMLNNSLMYNKEGTEVYQLAREMLDDVMEQIRVFKTADTDTSTSSHTRAASMAAKADRRKSTNIE